MPDMEKVIKGLEAHEKGRGHRSHYCDVMECPYRYWDESCDIEEMCHDALSMLKEQDELLRKLQKDKDKLCLEVSEWKHKYHDRQLKEQEAVVHCGDCENFCFDNISPNAGRCMLTNISHSKTWFCAHGKREEKAVK